MSRLPIVADDLDNWGDILNDYLLQAHTADGSLKDDIITAAKISDADVANIRTLLDILDTAAVTALVDDLSGVTDATTARANLSVYSQAQTYTQAEVTAIVANYLLLTGGTLSGFLILHADPTSAMQAATKQYVDNSISPMKHEMFTSTSIFTVPAGVTSVLLSGCGGGAGGGGGAGDTSGAGGGGGGAAGQVVKDFYVSGLTPLEEITVTITEGSAGAGGAEETDGLAGGDVIFTGHLTISGGGLGAKGVGVGGGAGGSVAGIGNGSGGAGGGSGNSGTSGGESISYNGGAGASAGGAPGFGGGGGGGASVYSAGGAGGHGREFGAGAVGDDGSDGPNYGAAGGGGGGGYTTGGSGGDGHKGMLIVKW